MDSLSRAPDGARLVLVTVPLPPQRLARLRALSPAIQVEERPFEQVRDDEWRAAEVLHTMAHFPLPELAPNLRWVQLHIAGAEHALQHPLAAAPVTFTTASGTHAVPVAEHVFSMLLSRLRNRPLMLDLQRRREWPDDRVGLFAADTLRGKSMGILGYGSIGRQVARVARAFGMRVLAMQRGTDRRDHGYRLPGVGDPEGTLPERYFTPAELHALLADSDVVLSALPLTSETRDVLDEAAFQAMKPTAYFVNVGRAGVCVEDALLRALREGWIAGAAVDVFHQEPLPADSPLWDLPNVDISPHVSANLADYDGVVGDLFAENLRRYLAGEPLLNVVDRARQY